MTIGERIKSRREELNMTQTELASKVGYTSKSTIARIESGSNQLKQKMIIRFANALDTTPAYLIGWDAASSENTNPKTESQIIKDIRDSLSEQEKEIIEIFRELDEEAQRQVIMMLAFLKEQSKNQE